MNNVGWISADMQVSIKPPPIPLIKVGLYDDLTTHIIKVNMQRNPLLAASETYNANMNTFNDGQPE